MPLRLLLLTKTSLKKPANPNSEPSTTVVRSGWSTISPPFDHDLFAYSIEAPSKLQQLLARYEDLIRLGGYMLAYAFLVALLLYRFRRRRSEQVAMDSDKPPYVWHIRIPEVEHLQFGPAFQRLLNRLRQRTRGGAYQLDVPGTIRATIQKAGMAAFQYRQQTRPPEYLLLIDQQSARNHRARLFDYIFRTFRANEVLAERFFYDGDPRICYNKQYPEGITLTDLLNRIKAGLEQNNISYFEVNPIGKRPTEGEQVQRINAQSGNKLVLTFSFGYTGSASNPVWDGQDKGGISARINSDQRSARLAAVFMEAIMRQTTLRNANLTTAPKSPSPLLNGLEVPVAIFQNGFLTNRENATLLVQPAFRQVMRTFYQTHQVGTSQEQLKRPFMELLRSVTKERKGSVVNRFFLENFRNLPGDGDSLEKMMAARFWFRRSIDGTDEAFYDLMLLTLQTFDPDFLYRQTN